MIKKEITKMKEKKKNLKMSLALLALVILMVIGCPSSNNGGGPDTTAPTLQSSNPSADSTSFSADASITLTYNEAVQAGTGNITIVPSSGGTTLTIAVGDAQVSIAGAVVTINPTNDLAMSTTYTLTIPAGAFMDAAGNKTAEATLSFSTAAALDTTAPSFDSSSSVPVADATDFPANSNIILTYSEAVQAGTGNITITPSGGAALTIAVTDAQVTIVGAVVTINPTNNLAVSTTYTLTVPAGAIADASGNKTAEATLSFSTAAALDTTAPIFDSSSSMPAADATDFPANSNIRLTYNEAVQAGTGNITIKPSGGAAITIAVGDAQVSIAGAVVTIDPTNNLAVSTTYTLTVPAGAIVDASGNAGSVVTLSFSTVAAIAPMVISSVPAADGINFPIVRPTFTLTFSEAVQAGTGNIEITRAGGSRISVPVDNSVVSISGAVVMIDLVVNLLANNAYTLSFSAGVFVSSADQTPVPAFSSNFTTLDTIAPTLSSSMPAANATGFNASSNIVLTYNEPVQAGTGDITITPSGGNAITIDVTTGVSFFGATVTINPTADLAVSTTYALAVPAGAIEDLATNDAAIVDLSFSTAAEKLPVVISSVPVAGATDFRADENIVLTFSEGIQNRSTSHIITITPMGGGTPITIAVDSAQVSFSGAVLTINPSTSLELNTRYDLTLPADAFNYVSNKKNAEITLSFTTAAVLVPRVISSVPAEGGTLDIPNDGSIIMLTYNEPIVKGSGNIIVDTSRNPRNPLGQRMETIAVSSPLVTISDSGTVVSINISEVSLNIYGHTFYNLGLTVPAAAFVDADGNNPLRDYTLVVMIKTL